ncbi:MAG: A24 family peptidase [Zoogloeaceae bacterium]|jgi:leader peptidase (prepilin peptidase)/N-methyltransferase|nr:A24 family peptidase [Zoogloeaceae bacterium]
MTSLLLRADFFGGMLGVLGLMIGSFLNVVIYRLPKMMEAAWLAQYAEVHAEADVGEGTVKETFNLATPRSRCPHCGHPISLLENIPVLSYLCLRGKCRACRAPISPRYPLIELAAALLGLAAAWRFGPGVQAMAAALLLWALLALAMIDLDTQLLPDAITLPLLWGGLLCNLSGQFVPLSQAVIGAMAGYLALWSVYWLFKLVTGKEGMGYGDFKLLAALGAWLGWQLLPLIILFSSAVGAIVGGFLIVLAKRGREVPIPFGPYLAMAGVIAIFWGKPLTQYYLRLI